LSKKISIILLGLFLIVPAILMGTYEVDLSGNVTLYGQEDKKWCGAACGKMIMNGYPDPADRIFYAQQTVWNSIQTYNLTGEPANWATDPIGLKMAMQTLNPPSGSWNVYAYTSRGTVMFEIMYWLHTNNYPIATLVNKGKHWVTVIGYESDIAPERESTVPVLKTITIHDPWPVNVGATSTVTANTWYNTYWNGAVSAQGTWKGHYVAVIDPPVGSDTSTYTAEDRMNGNLISAQDAENLANGYIDSLGLDEMDPYTMLQDPDTEHTDAMLVEEDTEDGVDEPQYYIVPYGFNYELPDFHRLCILVNGHTGAFEEIGVFGDKKRFLPITEAMDIALAELGLSQMQKHLVNLKMVFGPWYIPQTRFWPVWRVKYNSLIQFYIDFDGNVHPVNAPGVMGD
jgi:hypothetical protein